MTHPKWHFYNINEGDSHSFRRVVSDEEVRTFARITGDNNPIHVDETFAEQSQFGRCVVHGVLLLGFISKVLGRDFPGPGSVAREISCKFINPVLVNSSIRVKVVVSEKNARSRTIRFRTFIYFTDDNGRERIAVRGRASVIPPFLSVQE